MTVQQVKTLPQSVLNKLRRMEFEIREILDYYDLNRTYYIDGKPKEIKALSSALTRKNIPFEIVKADGVDHIEFEPEVYELVRQVIEIGQEKGKLGVVNIHQNSELYEEPEVEEEVNVYKDMYDFLVQYKVGRGHKEEASSYREELNEHYEDHQFSKKVRTIKTLLQGLMECMVIPQDKLDLLELHCQAVGIKL